MTRTARGRLGALLPLRSRAVLSLGAVVVVGALTGCTAPPPPLRSPGSAGAEPARLPAGITVELLQQRSDRAPGRLQIRIVNASSEDIVIESARLRGGPLSSPVDWSRAPATVRGETTVNLPVLLPPLVCDADPDEVVVSLGLQDGSIVVVEPDDPLGASQALTTDACAATDLARTVDVRATGLTETGAGLESTARLDILLTPTGTGDRVEVISLAPTVLITSPDGMPWPLGVTVDATSRAATAVSVELVPRRCDAHALAENKVGTLFALRVLLDGEEQTVTLPLAPGVSDRILAFVSRTCGLDG
ncbi:MAG: hypothetical protein ABWZ77_06450 [Naasia sp.]